LVSHHSEAESPVASSEKETLKPDLMILKKMVLARKRLGNMKAKENSSTSDLLLREAREERISNLEIEKKETRNQDPPPSSQLSEEDLTSEVLEEETTQTMRVLQKITISDQTLTNKKDQKASKGREESLALESRESKESQESQEKTEKEVDLELDSEVERSQTEKEEPPSERRRRTPMKTMVSPLLETSIEESRKQEMTILQVTKGNKTALDPEVDSEEEVTSETEVTEDPTEDSAEASTEAATEASEEADSEAATEMKTEASEEAASEAATETETKTEASIEAAQ
jgi:hypothetical protein